MVMYTYTFTRRRHCISTVGERKDAGHLYIKYSCLSVPLILPDTTLGNYAVYLGVGEL